MIKSSHSSSPEDKLRCLPENSMKMCLVPSLSLANIQSEENLFTMEDKRKSEEDPNGGGLVFSGGINIEGESIESSLERAKLIQDLQKDIMVEAVIPFYKKDLKSTFTWRGRWLCLSRFYLWVANVFLLFSSIMGGLQLYLPEQTIFSMCAVIGNVITLLFINFSGDMKKESRNLTTDSNNLLKSVGLNAIHIPQSQETRQINNNNNSNLSKLKNNTNQSLNQQSEN